VFRYVLRRLAISVPVLLGITVISYLIITLAPGDAVDILVDPNMSAQDKALKREALGLNDPIPLRYARWLGELLQGNLGYSFYNRQPVAVRIGERIGPTLLLTGTAIVVAYLIAIPLGVISAVLRYSVLDYCLTALGFLGVSIPSFFFGLGLIFIFALKLNLLPTGGMGPIGRPANVLDLVQHLILPVTVLALVNIGSVMRYTRASMLDVISQDYVRTARAKGLGEGVVIYGHALRNALIPVVTLAGLSLPAVLGGAIITEQIFSWPGMGRLAIESITQRDYPTLMALNLLTAVLVLLGNLLADIAYAFIDPRIRYG